MDEMGSFRVDVEIENPSQLGERRLLSDTLVDTGAELSRFPADVLDPLPCHRTRILAQAGDLPTGSETTGA